MQSFRLAATVILAITVSSAFAASSSVAPRIVRSGKPLKPRVPGRPSVAVPAKTWTPAEIVASLTFTQLRAWRRSDGATRFDVVITNTAPKAYEKSMGSLALQNYKLVGNVWKVAGGFAVDGVAPGKTFEIHDQPFSGGADATQFKSTLRFGGKEYASKAVAIGAEPGDVQNPLELKARSILSHVSYDPFTASTNVDGHAVWDLVVHNNTDDAFTADMGTLMLHCNQAGVPVCYLNISGLPARGAVAFRNKSFIDRGGNTFSISLNHNKNHWQPKTVSIAGAAERDARATTILKALTIPSLTVRRLSSSQGEYTLVIKNPTTYAFNRIGLIGVQTYGLVGNVWKPVGGWTVDVIPAGGTATVTKNFTATNTTKLKVKLSYKSTAGAETTAVVP